jgi:CHAT domain-containing protein/tetratricopeptide (TPR) repeat protein
MAAPSSARGQDLAAAVEAIQRASSSVERLRIAREHPAGVAAVMNALEETGRQYAGTGRFDDALRLADLSLELAPLTNSREDVAMCLAFKGEILALATRPAEAREQFVKALEIHRSTGNRNGEMLTMGAIAATHMAVGELAQAFDWLTRQRQLAHDLGDRLGEASAGADIATIYQSTGRYDEAEREYRSSLAVFREVKAEDMEAGARNNLANLLVLANRDSEALPLFESIIDYFQRHDLRREEAMARSNRANVLNRQGAFTAAAKSYSEVLELTVQLGARDLEAKVRMNLGSMQAMLGESAAARQQLNTALRLFRESGDRQGTAEATNATGILDKLRGAFGDALKQFDESATTMRELGMPAGEFIALSNKADTLRDLARYPEALATNGQAAEIARRTGDEVALTDSRTAEALSLSSLGRYDEAMERLEEALPIYRRHRRRDSEARTLVNIADVQQTRGEYARAERSLTAALPIARDTGSVELEATVLNNLALLQLERGEYPPARQLFEQAIALEQRRGAPLRAAGPLAGLSRLNEATGRYAESLEQIETALGLARQSGARRDEAAYLLNRGLALSSTARHAEAIRTYEEARRLAGAIGDRDTEATALMNIGTQYAALGRPSDAHFAYERARAIAIALGNPDRLDAILINQASVLNDYGQHDTAAKAFELALENERRLGRPQAVSLVLQRLGDVRRDEGRTAEADAHYQEALGIARRLGDRHREASILIAVGRTLEQARRPQQARAAFQSAHELAAAIGADDAEFYALRGLADLDRAAGAWPQAIERYDAALEKAERIRSRAAELSLQTSGFGRFLQPYYRLLEGYLATARQRDAFSISERVKARSLVDAMERGGAEVTKPARAEDRERERTLEAAVAAAAAARDAAQKTNAPAAELETRATALGAARSALDDFQRQLFISDPHLETNRARFAPASIEEVGTRLLSRTPRAMILSYVVGDEAVWLFALRQDAASGTVLSVHRLDVTPPDLRSQVERFREGIAQRAMARRTSPGTRGAGSWQDTARRLYEQLLGPVATDLPSAEHLIVIPDGILHILPFQALLDTPTSYVLEKWRISYAPSITALIRMNALGDARRRSDRQPSIAAIGAPVAADGRGELPEAEQEIKSVASLFGGTPLVGAAATEQAARAALSGADYVHFATHALLDPVAPLYSAIVLTKGTMDDGLLEARELAELPLSSRLVVLSGCETGLGRETAGEGLVGLTWAAFLAGAPASVVSQWSVADESTATLMIDFYKRLLSGAGAGVTKAEALHQAQLAMMRTPRYAAPFFWASFILTGDWR